jgi:hypothetical protein
MVLPVHNNMLMVGGGVELWVNEKNFDPKEFFHAYLKCEDGSNRYFIGIEEVSREAYLQAYPDAIEVVNFKCVRMADGVEVEG